MNIFTKLSVTFRLAYFLPTADSGFFLKADEFCTLMNTEIMQLWSYEYGSVDCFSLPAQHWPFYSATHRLSRLYLHALTKKGCSGYCCPAE